jgi:hypothetical protein
MIGTFQLDQEHLFLLEIVNRKYIQTGLKYGWKSSTHLTFDQGHWNRKIFSNSQRFPCDLAKLPSMSSATEINDLWNIICASIGHRALMRVYVNGYTYGTDGYAHVDDSAIDVLHGKQALSETAIVYLNKEWDINWCGETVLFDDDKEIAASILPKHGRVLVFNSDVLHAARPLSRICNVLRTVLVFKTFDPRIISEPVKYVQNNTTNIKHSGKSFFEHLFNTMMILEGEKLTDEVLLAGLYHSIYGTKYFKHDLNISRETVKSLIGEYSEHLVYEFCNMENRTQTLIDNSNNYDPRILNDLIEIEIANLKEQNQRGAKTSALIAELKKVKPL